MKLEIDIPDPFAERVLAAFARQETWEYRPASVGELEAAIKEFIWRRLYDYEKWQTVDDKEKRLKIEKEKW